jgi:hypothetical protein
MLLWGNAAYELDRYLSESDRITPGTAPPFGCPTEQLPYLKKGVPLYDATLAWINHDWGGCTTMPPRGRQLWYLVLRLSRGGNAPADSLKQWANWLVENIAAESRPTGNAPPLPSGSSPEQKELHPDGPGGGAGSGGRTSGMTFQKGPSTACSNTSGPAIRRATTSLTTPGYSIRL